MVLTWKNAEEYIECVKDERLWVPCKPDALDRLCKTDLPKDWLTRKETD